MKLKQTAPDGKPWNEEALQALGASMIICHEDGPEVEPAIDLSKYAEAARKALAAPRLSGLRAERNRRLAASDWTQLPDNGLADKDRKTWAVYRQALRDLPAKMKQDADPIWPKPPE